MADNITLSDLPASADADAKPTMADIPEYFAYLRTEQDSAVTILTLNARLTKEMVASDKDLVVAGDVVTVDQEIALPGRSVTLNARRIVGGGTIDVSASTASPDYEAEKRAKDGSMPTGFGGQGSDGTNGAAGGEGKPAGRICIVAESIEGPLALPAVGGQGGRGEDGGNGGRGHDGMPGADAKIRKAMNDRIVAGPTSGNRGGDGGKGGDGGRGGNGGAGGTIQVNWITGQGPDVLGDFRGGAAGAGGAAGTGGEKGSGGPGGRQAKCRSYPAAGDVITDCDLTDQREASGKDGNAGAAGGVPETAARGRDGSVDSRAISYVEYASSHPVPIEQRLLVLHKAKLAYLAGRYEEARDLALWLYRVTPAARPPAALAGAPASEWAALHARAETLLAQLNNGLDYYGYPQDHVPLVSLRYYQAQISSMLALGIGIEQGYQEYLKADKDQQKQRAAVRRVLDAADQALKGLLTSKTRAGSDKTAAQDTIEKLSADLAVQERILLAAQEKFQDALAAYLELQVFTSVLKAMPSLILMGVDAYRATKGIFDVVGYVGEASATVKGLVEKIEVVGKAVGGLKGKMGSIEKFNTPDTPDRYKLVMDRDEFDSMMKEFVAQYPEAQDYERQMHAYMDVIQSRNQKVMQYDSLALKEADLEAQIEQKQSEIMRVKDAWAREVDPSAPVVRTFMYDLYVGVKARILDYLYQENQAFNYWALARSGFDVADNSIAELAVFHTDLQGDIIDLMNARGKPTQPFRNVEIVLRESDMPAAFELFRASRRLSFSVPVTDSRFLGLAQAIATRFAVAIPGASTQNGTLYSLLRHNGQATFMTADGREQVFSHSQVTALYTYKISSGEYVAGGSLGGEKDEYIGLSPFACWTLELPDRVNPGLSLDQVTEVTIRFSGRALPRMM